MINVGTKVTWNVWGIDYTGVVEKIFTEDAGEISPGVFAYKKGDMFVICDQPPGQRALIMLDKTVREI